MTAREFIMALSVMTFMAGVAMLVVPGTLRECDVSRGYSNAVCNSPPDLLWWGIATMVVGLVAAIGCFVITRTENDE
jgi:hypothetical protein